MLTHAVAGTTTNYEYDNINQLTREYRGSSGSPSWQIAYGYDANGNRTYRNILGGNQETYANDSGDKLTSVAWSGGSKTFTYDNLGRRKTMTTGGATTTYNWDHESRITSITKPGMTTNTFGYNGLDARVSKTDSSGTRTYRRDGGYVTDPVLSDGAATYTPGVSESRSSTSRWLHSGIKNADSRTLTNQSVEATRDYDAFGNATTTGTWNGPFGYAGGYGYQEESDPKLQLLGHRYLDPETGRILSRDPVSVGRNWSAYTDGNPVSRYDADGLKPKLVVILGNMDGLAASALITGLKDRYGEKYDIVIRHAKTADVVERFLTYADAAILVGHGSPFNTQRGALTADRITNIRPKRQKLGKKQLDFIMSYSCSDCAEPDRRAAYLSIADRVFGYDDSVYPGSQQLQRNPTGPD